MNSVVVGCSYPLGPRGGGEGVDVVVRAGLVPVAVALVTAVVDLCRRSTAENNSGTKQFSQVTAKQRKEKKKNTVSLFAALRLYENEIRTHAIFQVAREGKKEGAAS